MTKNRSLMLLLMLVLLVGLSLGEDSEISRLAADAEFHPAEHETETQWAGSPGTSNADTNPDTSMSASPSVILPTPSDPLAADAQPEPAGPSIESQMPRVELLYVN